MKILTRVAVIFAVYCAAAISANTAAAADPGSWVSSDGRTITAPDFAGDETRGVVHGTKGLAAEGVAKDLFSSSPASVDTEEEYASLLRRKPKTATGSAESILGFDRRSRFYTGNFPHTAIGLITFDQVLGSFICTGWLVSQDTVVTAGHCVHEGFGGSFSTNIVFFPGKDGASNPFGSCTADPLNVYTTNGWALNGQEAYDYGAFKLNCNVGSSTGTFGFWWQSATLNNQHALIAGYPGDIAGGTQQWGSFNRISATQARQIFYFADTIGGQSGSPIFQPDRTQNFCQLTCAMGIHAYGIHGANAHATQNHGTRINREVFNNVVSTINLP